MCERCKELAAAVVCYLGDLEARANGNRVSVGVCKRALWKLLETIRRESDNMRQQGSGNDATG